jgi:hypothetical protein
MSGDMQIAFVSGRRGGKATAMTLSAVMAGLATGTEWLIEGGVLFFPPVYIGDAGAPDLTSDEVGQSDFG